jgi:hypothetical protein
MIDRPALLRQIHTEARPYVEQWLGITRDLNAGCMILWRRGELDGMLDDLGSDLWFTYYIRARGMGDIKIGKTRHIGARFKAIFQYTPRGADLIACYPSSGAHEQELKEEFAHLRLRGEWFSPGDELLTHLKLIGCDTSKFSDETRRRLQ